MAINPNIAMGYKAPDAGNNPLLQGQQTGLNMAKTMTDMDATRQNIAASQQQVEASKAQQANTEAQLPGIKADSAEKQRKMQLVQWEKDNSDQFMDPNGNVDPVAYVKAATKAGFADAGRAAAGVTLTNQSQAIANAKSTQEAADLRKKAYDSANAMNAHLLAQETDPAKREAMLRKNTDAINQIPGMQGLGDQVLANFGTVDPTTGKITVNNDAVSAWDKSSMTLKEQQEQKNKQVELAQGWAGIANTKEQLAQSGAASQTDAIHRDPNSALNKLIVGSAEANGLIPKGSSGTVSVSDLNNNKELQARVLGAVITPEAKQQAFTQVKDAEKQSQILDRNIALVDASGIPPTGKIGAWVTNKKGIFSNDAKTAELRAAVQPYLDSRGIKFEDLDGDSLKAALRGSKSNLTSVIEVGNKTIGGTTYLDTVKPGAVKVKPIQVKNRAEADALPPGTWIQAPGMPEPMMRK